MKHNIGRPQQIKLQQIRRSTPKAVWAIDKKVVQGIKATTTELGQLAPIIVVQVGDGYALVDGRHRVQAAEEEGREEIWAVVVDGGAAEAELVGLSSNLHRRRLSDPEFEAAMKRFEALKSERGAADGGSGPPATKREIAKLMGTNTTDVKRTRKLQQLSPACRAAFEAEAMSKGVAYQLTRAPVEVQDRLLAEALRVKRKELSRDEFRDMVTEALNPGSSQAVDKPEALPEGAVINVQELPRVRWSRLIDRDSDVPDDELKALSAEEANTLYSTTCDLEAKAGRMKVRLEVLQLGLGAQALKSVSGVKS